MQRSIWKGAISFGLVHIPVQLFSARDHKDLDLTMLDKRDFAPIGYQRINKETGKQVEWDDIVKGYEYDDGQYVVLSPEDLKRANVKATQTIDIIAFADLAEVPIVHYEQPYYLAPDKGGAKVYALLREALERSGMIGIAQVVIRTKQHLVALLPVDDMIVLNTLRYPDEIRPPDDLELPARSLKTVGISEKEVGMALELVRGMTAKWEPDQYHDTYREDVLALVKKKIKAKQTKTITEPETEDKPVKSAKIIDLMALLRQSVNQKGGGKGNKKDSADDGEDEADDGGDDAGGTARNKGKGGKKSDNATAKGGAAKAASKTGASASAAAKKSGKTGASTSADAAASRTKNKNTTSIGSKSSAAKRPRPAAKTAAERTKLGARA